MVDDLIRALPELTGAELSRLEAAVRRELELRRAGGDEVAPEKTDIAGGRERTQVLEYRPHADGHLQLELRRYVRKDGSTRERGPYWYFNFHEDGKRKKLYLGKTDDPEGELAKKRAGGRST